MQQPINIDPRVRGGGILLVDKPDSMSSHDVVGAVRRHVRPLRVGHTGTLDPLATGLLILCVGEATKIAGFIEAQYKLYRAVALLGTRTDTQDVSGKITEQTPIENVTEDHIRKAAGSFIGISEQKPPAFSAVKVGGIRAYKLARQKKDLQIKPRRVEIRRLEIELVHLPKVFFLVECSKGTYVRTLCNDLGMALGVGACMESLRRLAIGRFQLSDARPLGELNTKEAIMQSLLPASAALSNLPAVACTEEQAGQLAHGMTLTLGGKVNLSDCEGSWAQALGPDGELLAVGRLSRGDSACFFHPKKVLKSSRA